MDEFLTTLHNDLIRRWMTNPSAEYPDSLEEVFERLNPASNTMPHPETVGEAIAYWHLGVSIINGRGPYDPYKITPDGEVLEIIPE